VWALREKRAGLACEVITSTVFSWWCSSVRHPGYQAPVDALGTIAGRAGIAWDRTLLYGKASGAHVIDNYEVIDNFLRLQFPFPVLVESTSATGGERRWGWMVGVGVERLSSITDR